MSMSELIIILTIRRDRCSEPLIFSHNYRIKIPVPEYSTHAEPMLLAARHERSPVDITIPSNSEIYRLLAGERRQIFARDVIKCQT